MKRKPHRIALTVLSAGVCLVLAGCFSYTRETTHTATPAVEVPVTPESSNTTTTTTADGTVQREHSTTTTYP
jgi:hypothetical protein